MTECDDESVSWGTATRTSPRTSEAFQKRYTTKIQQRTRRRDCKESSRTEIDDRNRIIHAGSFPAQLGERKSYHHGMIQEACVMHLAIEIEHDEYVNEIS